MCFIDLRKRSSQRQELLLNTPAEQRACHIKDMQVSKQQRKEQIPESPRDNRSAVEGIYSEMSWSAAAVN
jgi:hypothetical protein